MPCIYAMKYVQISSRHQHLQGREFNTWVDTQDEPKYPHNIVLDN